jgi:hypothetical protein
LDLLIDTVHATFKDNLFRKSQERLRQMEQTEEVTANAVYRQKKTKEQRLSAKDALRKAEQVELDARKREVFGKFMDPKQRWETQQDAERANQNLREDHNINPNAETSRQLLNNPQRLIDHHLISSLPIMTQTPGMAYKTRGFQRRTDFLVDIGQPPSCIAVVLEVEKTLDRGTLASVIIK